MKFLKLIFLVVLISIFTFSCSPTKKVIDTQVSLEDILDRMKSNYEKINSYSASGNIDLNLRNLKMSLQFSMQAIKPNTFLIDVYGPLGIDIASVFLKDDSLMILNVLKDQLIKTSFNSPKLRERQFVDLFIKIIHKSLFGYLDVRSFEADSSFVSETEEKICAIKYFRGSKFDFCFDKATKFISEVFYYKNNSNENFEFYLNGLKESDKIVFPTRVMFNDSSTGESIAISFRKIQFNNIQDEIEFLIPDEIEVIEW